jgi:hypothetical protein
VYNLAAFLVMREIQFSAANIQEEQDRKKWGGKKGKTQMGV